MEQADLDRLVTSVDAATTAIDGFRQEITGQNVFNERTRRLIRRLWLAYALIALLGLVLSFVAVNARNTAQLASRNASKAVTQCEVLNDEGQRQRRLWEKVISNQPPAKTPEEAAAQAAQVAQFRKDMREAFPQQDCSKFAH